jgi:hypothetical protein
MHEKQMRVIGWGFISGLVLLFLSLATFSEAQTLQELLDHAAADIAAARAIVDPPPPPPPPVVQVQATTAQAQLDAAPSGSVLAFDLTQVYGDLTLRTNGVTLTTAGHVEEDLATLPGKAFIHGRLRIEASQVQVTGLAIGGQNLNDIVYCAEGATNVVLDNLYVFGLEGVGSKNGLTLNCADATIRRSTFKHIHRGPNTPTGSQETHGIIGYNGPGPFLIERNFIDGGSIGIMFGGADPTVPDLVPTGITIRHNIVRVPVEWRGLGYSIKNRLELKNARQVLSEGNLYENSFVDGQTGFGVVVTVRNQSERCPWCTVDGFTSTDDIIRTVAGGVSILASDDQWRFNADGTRRYFVSVPARNLRFTNLRIENMGQFTGNGRTFQYITGNTGDLDGLVLDNVTVTKGGWIGTMLTFTSASSRLRGLVVRGGTYMEGAYGIHSPVGLGVVALNALAPGYVWENVTVVRDLRERTIQWPTGTTLVLP